MRFNHKHTFYKSGSLEIKEKYTSLQQSPVAKLNKYRSFTKKRGCVTQTQNYCQRRKFKSFPPSNFLLKIVNFESVIFI